MTERVSVDGFIADPGRFSWWQGRRAARSARRQERRGVLRAAVRPKKFFIDWDTIANDCVGIPRSSRT
jgi:hypothetical protein